jgi:hypothetical protein
MLTDKTLQANRTDEEFSALITNVACLAIATDTRIIARVETTAGEIAKQVAATVAAETANKEVKKLSKADREQALGLRGPTCSSCNKHLDKFRKLVDRKEKVAEMNLSTAITKTMKVLRGEMENLGQGPDAGGKVKSLLKNLKAASFNVSPSSLRSCLQF